MVIERENARTPCSRPSAARPRLNVVGRVGPPAAVLEKHGVGIRLIGASPARPSEIGAESREEFKATMQRASGSKVPRQRDR